MTFLRQLDLFLAALALPLFLAAGLPILGWAVAAAAWLVQRGIQALVTRRATASRDPRQVVGLMAGSMIARGWLVAGSVFAVGVADSNRAGLSAAVMVIALFTVYFTMGMILRPFDSAAQHPAPGRPTGSGVPR
ncbi:MAG: hypothetical protein E6G56_03440 [Actinobacteria bacterium]|nr:MAG: hypothetical protein E6G56_03440 [Actinomycetota bacterium]